MPSDKERYDKFLKKYEIDKREKDPSKPSTHTRIAIKTNDGWIGGPARSYHIPTDKMSRFHELYYNHVIDNNNHEYLTEHQNRLNGGPILIDLDLKYNSDVKERQHDETNVSDVIECYVESLFKIVDLRGKKFMIYTFQRDNISHDIKDKSVVKDGIHIIISLHMEHNAQMLLRDEVIAMVKDNQPLEIEGQINSYDQIFDSSISSGNTNWQMYGSRKPGCESYKLVKCYQINVTNQDSNEYDMDDYDILQFDMKMLFSKLSGQYQKHYKPDVKEEYRNKIVEMEKKKKEKKKANANLNTSMFMKMTNNEMVKTFVYENAKEIKNKDDIEKIILKLYPMVDMNDTLQNIHSYAMLLDENYYNPYAEWISVGWALHNTHYAMFFTWILFSTKSGKFDFDDIPQRLEDWDNFSDEGYSYKSIEYWARMCNSTEYDKIKQASVSEFMEKTVEDPKNYGLDNDIAVLMHKLFGNSFVCTSHVKNNWYTFKNHKWQERGAEVDLGRTLSKKLHVMYIDIFRDMIYNAETIPEEYNQKAYQEKAFRYKEVAKNLKVHSKKKNIISECKEVFFDEDFQNKLDKNPYLVGFENGIYDIEKGEFRDGSPDDYVSMTTKINYVKINNNNPKHLETIKNINEFMEKLFPDEKLRQYMWEHAASSVVGRNTTQKFNIYFADGCNGKSMFVKLMNSILGDYQCTLDTALLTKKRADANSASPAVAKLIGKRYVSMNEGSKGDKINEGIMKQFVGGDVISARGLFKDTIEFIPQFDLVLCTNNLPEFRTNDLGTWRRVRICPYESTFKYAHENPVPSQNEFLRDDDLEFKLNEWKEIFMSMVLEKAVETKGKVTDCDKVLSATNKYKKEQDFIARFVEERIVNDDPESNLSLRHAQDCFEDWFKREIQGTPPRPTELKKYLEKKMGALGKKRSWPGWRIVYEYDE